MFADAIFIEGTTEIELTFISAYNIPIVVITITKDNKPVLSKTVKQQLHSPLFNIQYFITEGKFDICVKYMKMNNIPTLIATVEKENKQVYYKKCLGKTNNHGRPRVQRRR